MAFLLKQKTSAGIVGALLLVTGACSSPADDERGESELADRAKTLQLLAEDETAIASWLRSAMRPDGTLPGDYTTVLQGVMAPGCAPRPLRRAFKLQLPPKPVFADCGPPSDASRVLVTLPDGLPSGDINTRSIHMAAWDESVGRYRRYATYPDEAGNGMRVTVHPEFCQGCHGGAYVRPKWKPLMNELTNPWVSVDRRTCLSKSSV